jgi:ubiquinone/menaquinone biosynthesis C-methylase UbiE
MTHAEVLRFMRDPARQSDYARLLHDCYLDENPRIAAERFRTSAEFVESLRLLDKHHAAPDRAFRDNLNHVKAIANYTVLDLGAGTGIAAYAFARSGAQHVYALEPDPSLELGRGAIALLAENLPVTILEGAGERIPLADESVDVVYARQVLHHAADLPGMLCDVRRVLRPGGLFLACREHVVDDAASLAVFLARHPVHRLAGGEHAYSLRAYMTAIESANLKIVTVLKPFDSIINLYPAAHSRAEAEEAPRIILGSTLGIAGRIAGHLPLAVNVARAYLNRRREPGRLFSFLARKPQRNES